MNLTHYLPLFVQGIATTLTAWCIAASISLIIGTTLGLLSSYYIGSPLVRIIIRLYTFITKGIPAYVHILIIYFVLPTILHIDLPSILAASIALGLCSSGYVTEIIRAGINAISQGQWDASFVLGYSIISTLKRIIAPQVLRNILPALIGEGEQLLKSTSLLATIGVTEITRVGMNIISRELNPLPIYGIIAVIYLSFSALLQLLLIYSEKRTRYGYY